MDEWRRERESGGVEREVRAPRNDDSIASAETWNCCRRHVPIFAEHVLEELTGEKDFERALRKIAADRKSPPRTHTPTNAARPREDMVCVTLGARGAMMLAGDRIYRVSGIPVDVVDSTGAGDVFRGAFIRRCCTAMAPRRSSLRNLAAARSCTRPGAIAASRFGRNPGVALTGSDRGSDGVNGAERRVDRG